MNDCNRELVEKCAQGVHINWSHFLLNKLLDDAGEAQEQPIAKFHFSWILILIYFAVWAPHQDIIPWISPYIFLEGLTKTSGTIRIASIRMMPKFQFSYREKGYIK